MLIARSRAGRMGCPPLIHTPACRVAGWGSLETRVLLSKKETVEARQKAPHRQHKEREHLQTLPPSPVPPGQVGTRRLQDGLAPGPMVVHPGSRAGEEEKGTVRYEPSSAGTQGTQ